MVKVIDKPEGAVHYGNVSELLDDPETRNGMAATAALIQAAQTIEKALGSRAAATGLLNAFMHYVHSKGANKAAAVQARLVADQLDNPDLLLAQTGQIGTA